MRMLERLHLLETKTYQWLGTYFCEQSSLLKLGVEEEQSTAEN
jgi:hypothetical protein